MLSHPAQFESLNYLYILNLDKTLKGVISLKEALKLDPKQIWSKVQLTPLLACPQDRDPEQVSLFALKNNLKSVPIVGGNGEFVGIVTSRRILEIIDKEAVENILKMGGISSGDNDNVYNKGLFKSLRQRLPWLFIGLVRGLLISVIVSNFEHVIESNVVLAGYLPLVIYLSDAVGAQNQATAIRDLSFHHELKIKHYFSHHFLTVLCLASILSFTVFVANTALGLETSVNLAIASAIFVSVLSSIFISIITPFVLHSSKLDPADATGPIATVIQDTLSVVIYFCVAMLVF